ncbi:MAG: polysaccharide biosynthesis protein [Actinobacteria bacterium]|nr:polysaccharide biosynthesis protein [Actinomycetota bacterium]
MQRNFDNNPLLKFIIGDIRDKNILGPAMKNVDYVFHLAALKHIPVCEKNCWEAVLTNIYGSQNVIECAIENNVKKVIDISSSKAVDPFCLYGVTKACAEKLMINSNINYISNTKFVCIRSGNTMGTTGSVLPLFKNQILEKNEITITNPDMTRFLMSTRSVIKLVFEALIRSYGGEIFVIRMPSTTLKNIAQVMIELFGNKSTKQKTIDIRPGEKIYEVLVSKNESPKTKKLDENYYLILPQYKNEILEEKYKDLESIEFDEFNSNNARKLGNKEFKEILKKEKWVCEK